jgi:hypothetical protein
MRHRGHKKAVMAVAHAIRVTAYHLLARKTTHQEPGTDYHDRRTHRTRPPPRHAGARTAAVLRDPRAYSAEPEHPERPNRRFR